MDAGTLKKNVAGQASTPREEYDSQSDINQMQEPSVTEKCRYEEREDLTLDITEN